MLNQSNVGGVAPGSPPVALRAPSGKPGATPSTFHSFSISNPFLLTQFYPKFVSRIIGGGAMASSVALVSRRRVMRSSIEPRNSAIAL
jgi:hypothetical protein